MNASGRPRGQPSRWPLDIGASHAHDPLHPVGGVGHDRRGPDHRGPLLGRDVGALGAGGRGGGAHRRPGHLAARIHAARPGDDDPADAAGRGGHRSIGAARPAGRPDSRRDGVAGRGLVPVRQCRRRPARARGDAGLGPGRGPAHAAGPGRRCVPALGGIRGPRRARSARPAGHGRSPAGDRLPCLPTPVLGRRRVRRPGGDGSRAIQPGDHPAGRAARGRLVAGAGRPVAGDRRLLGGDVDPVHGAAGRPGRGRLAAVHVVPGVLGDRGGDPVREPAPAVDGPRRRAVRIAAAASPASRGLGASRHRTLRPLPPIRQNHPTRTRHPSHRLPRPRLSGRATPRDVARRLASRIPRRRSAAIPVAVVRCGRHVVRLRRSRGRRAPRDVPPPRDPVRRGDPRDLPAGQPSGLARVRGGADHARSCCGRDASSTCSPTSA